MTKPIAATKWTEVAGSPLPWSTMSVTPVGGDRVIFYIWRDVDPLDNRSTQFVAERAHDGESFTGVSPAEVLRKVEDSVKLDPAAETATKQ